MEVCPVCNASMHRLGGVKGGMRKMCSRRLHRDHLAAESPAEGQRKA
jgi:hypothetical protein